MPRYILWLSTIILASCTSLQTNPTVYPYEMNSAWFNQQQPKRVVVAPFSLTSDTRSWLQEGQVKARARTIAYLEKHGYSIVSDNSLRTAWTNAIRLYGNPWDPVTGKANLETLSKTVQYSIRNAHQQVAFDLVVIVDVIERNVLFEQYDNYRARWDGVSRKPKLVGPDNYVTEEFDWNRPVSATSVTINMYSPDFQHVFHSIGGIDLAQDINTRTGSIGFIRRENPFRYQSHIDEGIALAIHPVIPMAYYPAPKR